MIKVISATEMSRLEKLAYDEGASAESFMEAAGRGVAERVAFFVEECGLEPFITLLCGKGNNAGDGYVAGAYLLQEGFQVKAYSLFPLEECSSLCRQQQDRFASAGGRVVRPRNASELQFEKRGVILDAVFGTGFKGVPTDLCAASIDLANQSGTPIIAVDIPSGLSGDTGLAEGPCIEAAETLFLELPKTGFFLADGWNHVGILQGVDFGLEKRHVDQGKEAFFLLTEEYVSGWMPKIKRTRHKYEAGVVVALAGSPGMPGAALLSSLAALRGGCGLVRLLHPDGMQQELSHSPYELIKIAYAQDQNKVLQALNDSNACLIGPGIGRSAATLDLLTAVLENLEVPCVLDADALTLLSQKEIALPREAILTPHLGEMRRLLHSTEKTPVDLRFLSQVQQFADQHQVIVVLKGAPSFILSPKDPIVVSPTGNPGMATAGSGDVLTGLIAALLGQGLRPRQAAKVGVYLHGLAGEHAALRHTTYSMIASDVIEGFADAFATVHKVEITTPKTGSQLPQFHDR